MAKKLLIAEDNKFTATQYKKFLESKGYDVTVFYNGAHCIEKFKNELRYKRIILHDSSPPFDYVLLDHDMPKMNGSDASKIIHNLCPKQKIIFLSAYGQNILNSHDDSKEGFLQIMQKPFSLNFLLKKIETKSFSSIKRSNDHIITTASSPETIR